MHTLHWERWLAKCCPASSNFTVLLSYALCHCLTLSVFLKIWDTACTASPRELYKIGKSQQIIFSVILQWCHFCGLWSKIFKACLWSGNIGLVAESIAVVSSWCNRTKESERMAKTLVLIKHYQQNVKSNDVVMMLHQSHFCTVLQDGHKIEFIKQSWFVFPQSLLV